MARPTKAEQAKKSAKAKDPGTITPVKNEPPVAKTPVLHKWQAAVVAIPDKVEAAKTPVLSRDLQAIISLPENAPSSDLSVLEKLNQQEKLETEKLKKIVIDHGIPDPQGRPSGLLGTGMVRYWDNQTKKYGTEKSSILDNMIKFSPNRFKKI